MITNIKFNKLKHVSVLGQTAMLVICFTLGSVVVSAQTGGKKTNDDFLKSRKEKSKEKSKAMANKMADAPFAKGTKTLGLSVGAGVNYGYPTYYGGRYVNYPAIGLQYDMGFLDNIGPGNIGLGGIIAYKSAVYKYSDYHGAYKSRYTNFAFGVRGTYHLTLLKEKNAKFDPYAGVTLGLRIFRYSDNDPYNTYKYSYNSAYPIVGGFVGARYLLTTHIAAFAELGYDVSMARIGISGSF